MTTMMMKKKMKISSWKIMASSRWKDSTRYRLYCVSTQATATDNMECMFMMTHSMHRGARGKT